MRSLRVARLAALVLGIAVLLPARAATVEVLVREKGGGTIPDQRVILQPAMAPGDTLYRDWRRVFVRATGADGKAVFESVPVGRYTATVDKISTPGLIEPAANPLAPPPVLTLISDSDKASVEIELWRGSYLTAEAVVDRGGVPRAKVILRGLDGQPGMEFPLAELGRAERLLVPGR
jgi:hypothetical protein